MKKSKRKIKLKKSKKTREWGSNLKNKKPRLWIQ